MITGWTDIDRMFGAMGLLRSRLDNMYNDFDRAYGYSPEWVGVKTMPRTNLYDKGEHFELMAEVPGISKDQLSIKIQGNYIELSGSKEAAIPNGYRSHRNERASTTFSRSLTLPVDVDSGKVSATLKDGILHLVMPKAEAAKPRMVTIS